MRRALERRRQLTRLHNLIYRKTTGPRGDWSGFPSDVITVDGHHPNYPQLRGWALQCWQWDPAKTNRPYWVIDGITIDLSKLPPGSWLLRRMGDGPTLWATLPDEQFQEWKSWRPTRVKPAA